MSFHLLAVDATAERGSIALVNEDGVMEEVALHAPDGFAQVLFGEATQLLARHGMSFGSLDGFACASGPGSFTGVRVGLTAVMGLAEASGHKVAAVSNLKAVASFGTRALRAAVIDARRGQVYGAVYNAQLELVRPEVVQELPAWLASLPEGDIEVLSKPGEALAGAIGGIALDIFRRGEALDPSEIDANYVRRFDAELFWKDPIK